MDQGFVDGGKAALAIGNAIESCKGSPQEIKALASWFKNKLGSKEAAVQASSENTPQHSMEIYIAVEDVWSTFFKFNDPVKTGRSIARVAYWTLGPVEMATVLQ